MSQAAKKIAIISLGCDKNRVDTERMLGGLSAGNFVVSPESQAQIIIINTCAFINSARKEAIETILSTAKLKQTAALEKLIVTGCLPQKYLGEIQSELPEVDAFLGTGDYDKILSVVQDLYKNNKQIAISEGRDSVEIASRRLTTDGFAYLKIAEGCDNHCTYCTIPSIRGPYRSRPIPSLVDECETLAKSGIKEVVLVAQDVTNYGVDLYKTHKLPQLLQELSKTQIQKIRLLYCYPTLVSDQLIHEIKTNEKVVKYLDIPLQHVSDNVLKLMGRKETYQQITALVTKLRTEIPQIALRTTLMVGFPGETDQDFDRLIEFVKTWRFTHAGFFAYSKEQDTPSAKLKNHVSAKTKTARLRAVQKAQKEVVESLNHEKIGQILEVDYEGIDYDKSLFFGRSFASAPSVDPLVYFKADFAEAGSTVKVKIEGFKGSDLIGQKIE